MEIILAVWRGTVLGVPMGGVSLSGDNTLLSGDTRVTWDTRGARMSAIEVTSTGGEVNSHATIEQDVWLGSS